jgi:PAS domain S-box-containing protein
MTGVDTGPADAGRRVPPAAEDSGALFAAIANFTYDWETWVGLDGRARWINPAVERISGYTIEECLAMPDYPLPLIHEHDRAEIARVLADADRGGAGNDVEFRIRSKDGQIRWGAVSWQSITDRQGASIGYRTSVRDITERKRIQEALRLAHKKAERASLAKSKFLASASHDLRQPIQAMTLFVAALKRTRSGAERQEIIAALEDSLDATGSLLNALLDVSRLDAGVLQPRISTFAVGDLLDRMELEFAPLARNKGLRLKTVMSSATVRSDPALIERILRNLMSNALRYTEAGAILLGCRRHGEALSVEVWDTGIGIADAHHGAIFEEFHQVGNPERDRKRGLGLGLAIVRRLSRLLGHEVTLRSVLGRGSVFAVELPLSHEPVGVEAAADEHPQPAELAGTVILAIDDDPVQLKAIESVFTQWNSEVLTSTSAEDALIQLTALGRRPDAILADYRLREGRNGAGAIARVRAELDAEIPALILTGDTDPARIREATASGFELLHKPIRPEALRAKLVELLRDVAAV